MASLQPVSWRLGELPPISPTARRRPPGVSCVDSRTCLQPPECRVTQTPGFHWKRTGEAASRGYHTTGRTTCYGVTTSKAKMPDFQRRWIRQVQPHLPIIIFTLEPVIMDASLNIRRFKARKTPSTAPIVKPDIRFLGGAGYQDCCERPGCDSGINLLAFVRIVRHLLCLAFSFYFCLKRRRDP